MIATTLGGIGIFLIGMILLTEGLRSAAGSALRDVLQRFARGPTSAMASGAAVTALVQSSSATTLTTIGFVSAGLLTFPQAVGVIFGANVGTTSTGWIVATLGLKVNVAVVALPLVGVGALARLLGRGRLAHAGLALAGFGLIFVGIDALQLGMSGLSERFDPAAFPGATVGGHLVLVAVGLAMTVVMQSSSAAVATSLTALHTGAIDLEQAAYLVVGQNVGTTVTAALAAIGASVPARRTALAHILFNILTGAVALVVLPILVPLAEAVTAEGDDATAIALFHTAFNLLGVLALLPILPTFARWVERMVPEPIPTLTRHLDRSVAEIPEVAVAAAREAVESTARLLFRELSAEVQPEGMGEPPPPGTLDETRAALAEIRKFLGWLGSVPANESEFRRHLSLIHALDHLDRIQQALDTAEGRPPWTEGSFRDAALSLERLLLTEDGSRRVGGLRSTSANLAVLRRERRTELLEWTAAGRTTPDEARYEIEWAKRIDRLAYHAWRATEHLMRAAGGEVPDEGSGEVFEDREEEGEAGTVG